MWPAFLNAARSKVRDAAAPFKVVAKATTAVVMAVFSLVFVDRVKEAWLGPSSYKIYIVGNFGDSQDSSNQIRKAFLKKGQPPVKVGGVPVEIVTRNDQRDPEIARKVSEELARGSDTLMVIGHMYSTQTKAALPNYLLRAQPPIQVILTTETNPDILPSLPDQEYDRPVDMFLPVFRLSPTDDTQARAAAEFMINRRGTDSCWVVEDSSNPIYARYLALQFIRQMQLKGKKVLLWTPNLAAPDIESFRTLKADCVFFAGEWSNALMLIQQVRRIARALGPGADPTILLSDWAAEKPLVEIGGDLVNDVFLVHPMESNLGDYALTGQDARAVVDALLDEASRRFSTIAKKNGGLAYRLRSLLRMHRIADARRVLAQVMHCTVHRGYEFDLEAGRHARFTYQTTNDLASFHIWTVRRREFIRADLPPPASVRPGVKSGDLALRPVSTAPAHPSTPGSPPV